MTADHTPRLCPDCPPDNRRPVTTKGRCATCHRREIRRVERLEHPPEPRPPPLIKIGPRISAEAHECLLRTAEQAGITVYALASNILEEWARWHPVKPI